MPAVEQKLKSRVKKNEAATEKKFIENCVLIAFSFFLINGIPRPQDLRIRN